MAVKLRLMRMGKKKQPTYRLVAADGRSPRDGRFIEMVGIYDPRAEPSTIRIDNDKVVEWLRKGAQPTEQVQRLLTISAVRQGFRRTSNPPTRSSPASTNPSSTRCRCSTTARAAAQSARGLPRAAATWRCRTARTRV